MLKTPFYYYDLGLLNNTLSSLNDAISGKNYNVHYAIKANAEERVLSLIKDYGLGADCVSGNEVQRALDIGFEANEIVLAGVGKTDDELELAIGNNIHSINCESIEELEVINQVAGNLNSKAKIAFRLNPNIDAQTHRHITTGLNENKFGIPVADLGIAVDELEKFENIKLTGVHFHIGSQILSLNPYAKLSYAVNEVNSFLESRNIEIEHLNLGGGLGINYNNPDEQPIPNFEEYFKVFDKFLHPKPNQTVHFELGRSIVGQMGSLISKVLYVKAGKQSNFAIIDAGMTDLIRPALYNSYHRIENISSNEATEPYKVVGPICESTDTFGEAELNKTQRGDLLMIRSAGAYGQVLSSNYNLRDRAESVYSDEVKFDSIVKEKRGAEKPSEKEVAV
ncbi:MAG: diaminopimelate decarboxylase [Cyclobacteriaceae bacterium]